MALTIGGTLLLAGPLVYRLTQLEGRQQWVICGGGVVLYVLYALKELRISVGEIDREEAVADRGTMPLASLAKNTLLVAALLGGGAPTWALGAVGLGLFLTGVLLRSLAVRRLGAAYSHRLRTPEALVTDGIYGTIRHPAYLGTILAHGAIPFAFPNPFSIAAWAGLWLPVVIWRTIVEERLLRETPGHAEWAARTWRLLPGIW